ncbi:putative ketoreductase [Cadophora sp. DSE1049]|nr:putative ketoreductase [Cadophora sp. DSE1049]
MSAAFSSPLPSKIINTFTPALRRLQGVASSFSSPTQHVMAGNLAMKTPLLRLRDGNNVPMLAFGTGTAWFKEPEDHNKFDKDLVLMAKDALEAGFRHLDCAEMYDNEAEAGKAIKESGIPREELFVTTKVADGIKDVPKAIDESLKRLQLDYVDLYLVHEPWNLHTPEDYQNVWRGMEEVKASGKAKSIGVSNFVRKDLEMILKGSPKELPAVNQLEYHPYIQRENDDVPYIPWMQEQGIQVEAFKGLTPLARCPEGPLVGPLERMAKAHNVSDSAVMLRWFLQQNIVAITTTRKKERLQEYAEALTFELTKDEMDEIFTEGKKLFKRFYFPERYDPDDRS